MAQGSVTREGPKHQASEEAKVLRSYGCGAQRFAGAPDALYERHLKSDNVVAPNAAGVRDVSRPPPARFATS